MHLAKSKSSSSPGWWSSNLSLVYSCTAHRFHSVLFHWSRTADPRIGDSDWTSKSRFGLIGILVEASHPVPGNSVNSASWLLTAVPGYVIPWGDGADGEIYNLYTLNQKDIVDNNILLMTDHQAMIGEWSGPAQKHLDLPVGGGAHGTARPSNVTRTSSAPSLEF